MNTGIINTGKRKVGSVLRPRPSADRAATFCRSCGRPMRGTSRYHDLCDRCWREASVGGEEARA